MMKIFFRINCLLLLAVLFQQCNHLQANQAKINSMDTNNKTNNPVYSHSDNSVVNLTEDQWKKILPKNVYDVARQKGTERPYSSPLEENHEIGTYYCAVCGNPLFKSDTKFESGCGWPSFYEPVSKSSIIYLPDHAHGMERTEVECGRCKSHLGHVFNDGPPPTGLRYCINGVVLDFEKAKDVEKKYNEEHGH
ncbi:MAG TPA: peptide-methionine (R)-S-oxide reductase MsrB [Puia sp.]|jgi:peptide-methionine (R)-S-oxide reductase|nr:peptide-methionine (R)-S-oxide reductase MsrB [Puia sp.]